LKPAEVRVTTDGSVPTIESRLWRDKIAISETTTLRATLFSRGQQMGPVAELTYRFLSHEETAGRTGIVQATSKTGRVYQVVDHGLANGKRVYTDRDYTFRKVPAELEASILLQTPNDDSGSQGGAVVEFETVLPMTVFLGHDTRVAKHPAWLTDPNRGFSATDLEVSTSDARFRVYSRSFPAGRISLGGNTDDGLPGGKSNYLVILRPEALPKLAAPTTMQDVLPLVEKANAARGKAIFLASGGVGCAKCHRTDGTAKSFGPDLAHLVQKRDPVQIVNSMLDPSAEIKEGFATQMIVTTEGKTVSGLLRAETA
jgi:mono/diheme cytochrome c family protein